MTLNPHTLSTLLAYGNDNTATFLRDLILKTNNFEVDISINELFDIYKNETQAIRKFLRTHVEEIDNLEEGPDIRTTIRFRKHPTLEYAFILDPKYSWNLFENDELDETVLTFQK